MSHVDRIHATLAPSAAHRWMNCPGSVQLCEGLEAPPSDFAAEGTAAHMLAELCMDAGHEAERFRGYVVNILGERWKSAVSQSTNADGKTRFEVDDEMVDGVQLFLDVAREIAEQSDEFEIEQRLDVSDIIPGSFGTGDAIAYRESSCHELSYKITSARVTIVDFKYGKHTVVEPEHNEQLLTYALGVAKRYHNRGIDEVELVIVQPRAPHARGPVRRWLTDVGTLYEHAIRAQSAAVEADEPDPTFVPGEWCKYCKAAAICGSLRSDVYEIIGAVENGETGEMFVADPTKYKADTLAHSLRNKSLVAGWLRSVETFGYFEATRGRTPPGFKLVRKKTHRKWKHEDTARDALMLVGELDEADIIESKMRSPAQVEKLLPKGQRKLVNELASNETNETVLAELDDPRPAVDPTDASGFEATEIEERD